MRKILERRGGQGRSHKKACVCPAVRRAGLESVSDCTVVSRGRTRATKECGGTGAVGQRRQGCEYGHFACPRQRGSVHLELDRQWGRWGYIGTATCSAEFSEVRTRGASAIREMKGCVLEAMSGYLFCISAIFFIKYLRALKEEVSHPGSRPGSLHSCTPLLSPSS